MNVLHFAVFMNTHNDLFIFPCHQIPLSLHLSQHFPPQTGPPVKIQENNHDINLHPALEAQVCNPSYSGGRDGGGGVAVGNQHGQIVHQTLSPKTHYKRLEV
jgi:hypothetical protein